MRIQHNITAMNSYRNYSANTKAVGKNLEKLSSGYKINRAGDDAAGLAISEKMRAQITGLETAQKNAKDGISLVQTAEGSLTEVHSMLNRMFELGEQSANGTYDNSVDRANLQKEVSALKTEIDRIADSSNFNGIKLLDGSLGSAGASANSTQAALDMSDAAKLADALKNTAAVKQTMTNTLGTPSGSTKTAQYNITYTDDTGAAKTLNIQMKADGAKAITYSVNGGDFKTATTASTAVDVVSAADAAAVLGNEVLKDTDLGKLFDVSAAGAVLTFTAKQEGATKASVLLIGTQADASVATTVNVASATTATGADAYRSLDTTKLKSYSAVSTNTNDSSKAEDCVFTVDGKKFAFANKGEKAAAVAALGSDVTIIESHSSNAAPDATDAAEMAKAINVKLGYDGATVNGGTATQLDFKAVAGKTASSTGGLTLQIGDSAEAFNQLTVNVGDMHVKALDISSVDISTQSGASAAMAKIKTAINTVSSTRGDLGALQNRLDHTINNLSVMQENIQDAESTIRDVDVAKEMMAYTKNNILVQSAQAMLAQANQAPQGVLQLLQ